MENKGISNGNEEELVAGDGEAMKIGVRAVSKVCECEVRCRSVGHDHFGRIELNRFCCLSVK